MKIFREILSPLIAVLAAFIVGGIDRFAYRRQSVSDVLSSDRQLVRLAQ